MKFYRYPVDIPPAYITWGFGAWDNSVLTSQRYQHRGIDIGCPVGTPMYSPGAGTVYEHKGDGSFGLNVSIAHADGYYSIMAHMSNPIVNPGDIVVPGQLVGYSGNTGLSTGPHVHWQVCLDSWFPRDITRSRDPETFLVDEPIPEEGLSVEDKERLARLEALLAGNGIRVGDDTLTGDAALDHLQAVKASAFGSIMDMESPTGWVATSIRQARAEGEAANAKVTAHTDNHPGGGAHQHTVTGVAE